MKKIFQTLKTKRWIIALCLIIIASLAVGRWQFLRYKDEKSTQPTTEQAEEIKPEVKGEETTISEEGTTPEATTPSSEPKSSQQAAPQFNSDSNQPQPSNPPNDDAYKKWCENSKAEQRKYLKTTYDYKIYQENRRFEKELDNIKGEYEKRGGLGSGLYLKAVREATERHNWNLESIDAWYQLELWKIEDSC